MEVDKQEAGRDLGSEAGRIEHLKLIQAVVDRLGRNSFTIKSTAAAASAALVAVTASVSSPLTAFGGLAILSLWLLDARFLRQERSFRRLYNSCKEGTTCKIRLWRLFHDGCVFRSRAIGRPLAGNGQREPVSVLCPIAGADRGGCLDCLAVKTRFLVGCEP